MTYLVNVTTSKTSDGCFSRSFTVLGDELRAFVAASAASFRRDDKAAEVKATILRSGDTIEQARVFNV